MAVTVHVAVNVGRRVAVEIESVLPPETEKNRNQHNDADRNAMPDEFVADHGLNEKSEQRKCHDLREGDDEQLLEILQQFEVVIAKAGLDEDAADHRNHQQDYFDKGDRDQLGKPVDALAHRQRIVYAVKVDVALLPDQFGSIKSGHDQQEKSRAALD